MKTLRCATLFGALLVAAVVALPLAPAVAQKELAMEIKRDAVSLNGRWQSLQDHESASVWQPAVGGALTGWQECEVPGPLLPGRTSREQEGVRCVWARREFVLNRAQAARQAVLKWNGIRFGPTVWVNGERIATHTAVGPATYLLPPGLLREGANRIVVQAPGWSGVPKSQSGYPLIPTGASTQTWGTKMAAIFDDIWVEFYDRAYMKWILAIPSLTEKKVTLRVHFDSVADLPDVLQLQATLAPPEGSGLKPVTARLDAAPTKGAPVDFEISIERPVPWTPQSPRLYTVKVSASAGGRPCDTAEFRFGMREVAVEGGHYRLNRQPLWLRGSNMVNEWYWGPSYTQNVKRYLVEEARLMNLNCFRTHTQPPVASWCDVADENGIFFLAELPVLFNFANFRFTPEEWKAWHANALLDATGWVTKLWNHPSVLTWVLSNESTGNDDWEAGEFYRHVLALDPTRPPMRSAGLPKGTAKTLDFHTCGNTARGPEGWAILAFQAWAARRDPARTLGNSEYMNYTAEAQSLRWFGKDGLREESRLFYAQLCTEHTEAMRRLQLDLILPYMYAGWTSFGRDPGTRTWHDPYPTPMAAALHSCMAPALASLDLFDANHVAGSEATTPLALINELPRDVDARIDLYVTPANPLYLPDPDALATAVSHERLERTLKANTIANEIVRWKVPERPGTYYLAAVLTREGERPVVSQREIRALADPAPARRLKGHRLVVLGADEAGLQWLRGNGAVVATESDAVARDAPAVVIWDAGRVSEEQRRAAPAILDYVRGGGRLVVLDQARWDWPELAGLEITAVGGGQDAAWSRAFPCPGMGNAPLLAGLFPEALRRWNGLPGTVADSSVATDAAGAEPLLWAHEPKRVVALRITQGQGEILVCMLRLKGRLAGKAYDPAAVQMMMNLIGGQPR